LGRISWIPTGRPKLVVWAVQPMHYLALKRHHCVTRLTDGHHSREAVSRQREGGIGHQFRLYFLQFGGNTDFDLLFCLSITLLLVLRLSFLQSVLEPNLSHTYPQPYFPQIPPLSTFFDIRPRSDYLLESNEQRPTPAIEEVRLRKRGVHTFTTRLRGHGLLRGLPTMRNIHSNTISTKAHVYKAVSMT